MQPALDLTRTAFSRPCGDIIVHGTWYRRGASGSRPCLALVRANVRSEEIIPCVVPLDDAWVFDETLGEPRRAAVVAYEFARRLGLNVANPREVYRVASLIHDHLGDLLAMPPEPARALIGIGTAKLSERESGRVLEHEVTTRV